MGLRFLALVCLVGAAFAGPVQRQSESRCAKECHLSSHPKLRYEPGKAYIYEYKSQNNITSVGNPKQNATIEGTVEFHLLTHCEGILKIKNIRLQQKVSQDEKDDLIKKLELPLTYSYYDGKFDHVCPHPEESTQSLNLKKGIISSIVNELPTFEESQVIDEVDSLGKCRTKYTVQGEDKEILITKTKDLKSCTKRHTFITFFIKKNLPSSLLFKDDHLECKQYVSNGVFHKVVCYEHEKLKTPLKNRESVIEFSGKIQLSYTGTKPAEKLSWQEPVNEEEISYSIDEPRDGDRNVKEVERVLKSLCSTHTFTVPITVGKDFIKLVSLVKSLKYRELEKIDESLKDGTLCSSKKVRDIFVDTLPIVATDPAIKLMVKLLVNDEVTGLKSKLWPATLALKQKPTKDTVAAIVPLVKKDPSTSTLIGVATLINHLCSSEDCDKIPAVGEVVAVLNDYLGSKCSSDDEKQILKALRTFGNMGYHGKASKNIIACAKDSSKPIRIRMAAIDSFRRINDKKPQEFLHMYSDKNEDYTIRIACFQSVFKHADKKQLKEVKKIAESETHEQVSGYVYTYIQNINKTHSSKHQNIKGLLQDIKINAPKVDYLTNSKNIELSAFYQPLKLGGSVETDMVHGEKTKLPLSVRTRFDVDLFGQDINVLDVGVRAEGIENIIQNLIALKDKIPKFEQIRDKLAQKPSLEELKDEFSFLTAEKVFGDSVPELAMKFRTLEIELLDVSTSDLSGIKEMLKIAELMTKLARGQDADFSHSFIFMSSKLVVPSVTGRSYSIDLTGSSTVGLTAKSKADLLNLPKNADVHLHFNPSVNLEISVTAGIQSNTHRPDIKHVSRLHLESDVEARVEVRDGHVAIVSLTLPSENIALAKMRTDVYEIDEDHNEKLIFQRRQKKFDHCFTHLNKPLGISACASVEVPRPFVIQSFPYIVPFGSGEIALKKSDNSFKSYVLRLEIPKQVSPSMKYKASFDTPGSTILRRFAADLEVKEQRDQKDVLLKLVSPFKTVGGSGKLKSLTMIRNKF
ncbi:vitellogenin-like [Argiope bruennichi]|uniref:vitellogenin-like n=1 Tax=Argiope bruennichi TaxID=94029 RepID=UPI002494C4AF|nr:vitellogenin-like [Argiope bruennichi]